MALLAPSAVERKKAEANEHTFVVRPPVRDRFPVPAVKEILRAVLRERLDVHSHAAHSHTHAAPTAPSAAPGGASNDRAPSLITAYSGDVAKELADEMKLRLKALALARYKLAVCVTVCENKGAGVVVATRTLWDTHTDAYACESFSNVSVMGAS